MSHRHASATLGLLLSILITSSVASTVLYSIPACWYRQYASHGSTWDEYQVVSWDVYSSATLDVPIDRFSNHLSPKDSGELHPTHFEPGWSRGVYQMPFRVDLFIQTREVGWILNGNSTVLAATFFVPENMCAAKFQNDCLASVEGFCNTLDACEGRGYCDETELVCTPLPSSRQTCAQDRNGNEMVCDPKRKRCIQCRVDGDCLAREHSWCDPPPPTCNARTGMCIPSGGSGPCDGEKFGCSVEFELCNECATVEDCTAIIENSTPSLFCNTQWSCTRGQCIRKEGKSPCNDASELCMEETQLCIPLNKEERGVVYTTKDEHGLVIVGIDTNASEQKKRDCVEDSDCWTDGPETYTFCAGGKPFCEHIRGTCSRRGPPSCGSGYCSAATDQCAGCSSDNDCISEVNWCSGKRVCDVTTGECRLSSAEVCPTGTEYPTCLESMASCVTSICSTDADCTNSTFCGGTYRCDIENTGTCYLEPNSIPCQGVMTTCDERSAKCVSSLYFYIAMLSILLLAVLLLAFLLSCCPAIDFCNLPKMYKRL
jgi:hypothetical protein